MHLFENGEARYKEVEDELLSSVLIPIFQLLWKYIKPWMTYLDSRTLFFSDVRIKKFQVKLVATVIPGEHLLSALQIEGLLNIYIAFPHWYQKMKKAK